MVTSAPPIVVSIWLTRLSVLEAGRANWRNFLLAHQYFHLRPSWWPLPRRRWSRRTRWETWRSARFNEKDVVGFKIKTEVGEPLENLMMELCSVHWTFLCNRLISKSRSSCTEVHNWLQHVAQLPYSYVTCCKPQIISLYIFGNLYTPRGVKSRKISDCIIDHARINDTVTDNHCHAWCIADPRP